MKSIHKTLLMTYLLLVPNNIIINLNVITSSISFMYFLIISSFTWSLISNMFVGVSIVAICFYLFYKILIILFKITYNHNNKIINRNKNDDTKILINSTPEDLSKMFEEDINKIFKLLEDTNRNILLYKGSIPHFHTDYEVYIWNSVISRVSLFNNNIKILLLIKVEKYNNFFLEFDLSEFSFKEKRKLMWRLSTCFKKIYKIDKWVFPKKKDEFLNSNSLTRISISSKIYNHLYNKYN